MVPEQDLPPLSQYSTSTTTTPQPTCISTQDTTLLLKECDSPMYKRVCLYLHLYVLVLLTCERTLAEGRIRECMFVQVSDRHECGYTSEHVCTCEYVRQTHNPTCASPKLGKLPPPGSTVRIPISCSSRRIICGHAQPPRSKQARCWCSWKRTPKFSPCTET